MLKAEELQAKAWAIVAPAFWQPKQAAIAQSHQFTQTGKASHDIRQILPAAVQGRVAQLLVKVNVQQWGRFDRQTQQVELHTDREPGDEELLDFAAIQTILNDGQVYAIDDLPDEPPLAAVFRY